MFVCPDIGLLFNFLAAGFGVRLEVKVHDPGVEDEVRGRQEQLGERAHDLLREKVSEKV